MPHLTLADGTTIHGVSFGSATPVSGEVVFNTGMVGYPESFTDPSYKGQILVLTYPIVGNYGVPAPDADASLAGVSASDGSVLPQTFESGRIQISGLIVDYYSEEYSHCTAVQSLAAWLKKEGIPALQGVDTRALTKKLRETGVMLGKIDFDDMDGTGPTGGGGAGGSSVAAGDDAQASAQGTQKGRSTAQGGPVAIDDPNLRNLVAEVSTKSIVTYTPAAGAGMQADAGIEKSSGGSGAHGGPRILLYDCGVKNNIIRSFLVRGASVIRVPWDFDPKQNEAKLLADGGGIAYDGVFISNGPGDPKQCVATIEAIRWHLSQDKPLFGICLGNQLLALAAGGDTYKLKYGHRGQNQPCILEGTPRCVITSQNHGFAVNTKTLSKDWEALFVNANDATNEGIRHTSKPFFSVQFHPEAYPGPVDTAYLFDDFLSRCVQKAGNPADAGPIVSLGGFALKAGRRSS
ncbi:carbamoyl phosphate synthase small subunit [Candidatus Woesearchaeota archaeon CG1_02_57_44]|nr:MAG: carbamoyl phosphate synthase small subunit [Candidatus Woesearchaeota archaeon CG1_02_57_44]